MIITYDTEFLDDGKTIELISFGMVAEDGRELYLVNGQAPWRDISLQPWLAANVLCHLDGEWYDDGPTGEYLWRPTVAVTKKQIAVEVEHFLINTEAHSDPELWAYYSATDHVVGYQLFGSMIVASRDHGWPMRTNCLAQEEEAHDRFYYRVGASPGGEALREAWKAERPVQDPATEHHALHDARHDMALARWLGLCR